ncbi:MAG: hypothetical protein LBL13_04960 [Bacteroidales bacterium]|jgi:hypothetical protein|nr:hypothetical protein [Bacteroidales bacterium]
MVDVLLISLPSFWGRKYVYVENYWMILLSQYISSYSINISVMDAALENAVLTTVEKRIKLVDPKIVVFLVTKKNQETVAQTKEYLAKQFSIPQILFLDDTFSFEKSNSLILDGISSINENTEDLVVSICSLLNKSPTSHPYSNSTLFIGRDYLNQVLLEGGEFEVLGRINTNKNYFPLDYKFDTHMHPQIEHGFETMLIEVKTICHKYSLRKVNIIDDELINDLHRIDVIKSYLNNNNLSHVKIGLLLDRRLITNENMNFIISRADYINKIIITSDLITSEFVLLLKKIRRYNIKIKVQFCLFNEGINIEYIRYVLKTIRNREFYISPKALISGAVNDPILLNIKKIMTLIYNKIFHSYHIKIIQFENDQKYELRTGVSKAYGLIPKIQNEVEKLSHNLNTIFIDIFESVLFKCDYNNTDTKNIVLDILAEYENKFLEIGGEIDAHLSDSCRI